MARQKKINKRSISATGGLGTILPRESRYWKNIMQSALEVSKTHNFHYIETPIIDSFAISGSKKGQKVRPGEGIKLRSDALTSIIGSYIENQLGYFSHPLKVFYLSQIFRTDNNLPASNRLGFGVLGDNDPIYDGEIILTALNFFNSLDPKEKINLSVNVTGCRVCFNNYRERLVKHYNCAGPKFCKECRGALKEKKVHEIFSCVGESCRKALIEVPVIFDHLCQGCNNHFHAVLELLEDSGTTYELKADLIRDPSRFNRTVFNLTSSAGDVLATGGRFDCISENIFSKSIPGVGFEVNMQDLIKIMTLNQKTRSDTNDKKIFFVAIGTVAKKASLKIISELRRNGIIVADLIGKNSLSVQLRGAQRHRASIVLILGQKELSDGMIILRNIKTGVQENIVIDSLIKEVKKRLK